ncbi:hypothetical protein HZH68_015234 [Vespula germanica]|uniref:Nuclear protein 1 n=2 Tax=Vespidae TaxID=7438 RepID=A0A834J6G6_VESGE|nr:hypothetical protein HZH68_015234 [Vespula germanica]
MSDNYYVDEYEHFNYDYDKHIFTGHGGKQRSKREADAHTNHFDPSGHSRKILTKLMNSEHNKRQQGKTKASFNIGRYTSVEVLSHLDFLPSGDTGTLGYK